MNLHHRRLAKPAWRSLDHPTSRVAMTPSAIRKHADTVSTASNNGSLSSWRSLLYVEGNPLRVIKNPAIYKYDVSHSFPGPQLPSTTFPNTRPDLPRRSSRESAFFFCGIILEPVLQPNPPSIPSQRCQEEQEHTYMRRSM